MNREAKTTDILLYVAMKEEFDVAMKVIGGGFQPQELSDIAITCFHGEITCEALQRKFRVAIVPAGKMGNTRSANVTSALIEKLKPNDIVVVGIAGSLSNDLHPGDVFIPDSVNEYLANSAAKSQGDEWYFETSGNHLVSSVRLLNRFQVFAHAHTEFEKNWRETAATQRQKLITPEITGALVANGLLLPNECYYHAGDDRRLASGPAVGKGKAFVNWVTKEVDRKVAAIEMESAGVYDASIIRTPAPRALAIRGISDYADERKDKIEDGARNRFRELSAQNALSLLLCAIKAGVFELDSQPQISLHAGPVEVARSTVKMAFVIGGETNETADADAERPRLHNASLKLGRTLAAAGAELLICSPFPDSVDYYVAMGYADGSAPGVIHFHSPSHPDVQKKRDLLKQTLGRGGLLMKEWNYPGPESDDSWPQAWLLAQLQALERADVVIALGGNVSKTANTLLHLAESKGLPIVPFEFLGGAARRAFKRRNWAKLNPELSTAPLMDDKGVDSVISIANKLIADRMAGSFDSQQQPRTVFVSFARKDEPFAIALAAHLSKRGLEVLTGDAEIRANQMVNAAIEQAIQRADIVVLLWSKHYGLSPWCFDELSLAKDREARGQCGIWLFNLDDSLIVPMSIRKLPVISVRSQSALIGVADELLARYTPKNV